MQQFKRVLSLILALVLLLGNMPAVYASDVETIPEAEIVETEVPQTTEAIPEETVLSTQAPETEPAVAETVPAEEVTEPATEPAPAETIPEETVPEETIPEETVPEETEGEFEFVGLPEGYALSEKDAWHRQALLDHGYPAAMAQQTFEEDQILVFAADEAEAALFAEVFGGTLTSFIAGIAQISLTEMTAYEAVEASLAGQLLLPAASPNHTSPAPVEVSMGTVSRDAAMAVVGDDAPTEGDWYYWVQAVGVNDPDLQDPADADFQWWHDMMDTYAAWGVTMGRSSIDIAVVTEYSGAFDTSLVTIAPQSGPNSGDSWDYEGNVDYAIGALDNGKYGAGIAPNCAATIYKSGSYYEYYISAMGIVECLIAAALNEHQLILVESFVPYYSPILEATVADVLDQNIPIIATVGDFASNAVTWPAGFDGVIGVAAVGRDGNLLPESNFGSYVDLAAPAVEEWNAISAASLVAGAAALYIYKHPGVTPAALEKALEAACVKSSDKNLGAGVLNLAKLFGGKPATPELWYFGSYVDVPKGTMDILPDNMLFIRPEEASTDREGMLLISDNGKDPAVKDGKIVNGWTTDMVIDHSYFLDLTKYVGQKVTLKAAWVSGTGVMGDVLTLKLNVLKYDAIDSIVPTGPGVSFHGTGYTAIALSGKTYTYGAELIPMSISGPNGELITSEMLDESVTWKIVHADAPLAKAKIDSKTGKLTIPAKAEGMILLEVRSVADTDVYAELTVEVNNESPVKTVTIGKIVHDDYYDCDVVYVESLKNAAGNDLTHLYLPTFGVQWTSSNPKVAQLEPITGDPSAARIIPIGPGKVTFTATVLDGGKAKGTSASYTVKQLVDSIQLDKITYYVQPGKSIAPKATVMPNNATDKTLLWTVSGDPGITIDQKTGKVTVAKNVLPGAYADITVVPKDGGLGYCMATVRVLPKCDALSVGLDVSGSLKDYYSPTFDKNGNLTALTMYTVKPQGMPLNVTEAWLSDVATTTVDGYKIGMDTIITSSNPEVVSVDTGSSRLVAHKAGTAKITVASGDGVKKHTITVQVEVPASSINVSSSITFEEDGGRYLAEGATAKHTAVLGDTYGKVTNTKNVIWDLEVELYHRSGSTPEKIAKAESMRPAIEKLVTFKNGALTFKKGLYQCYRELYEDCNTRLYFHVRAMKDGLVSEEVTYAIVPKTNKMTPEYSIYTIDTGTYVGENLYRVKVWTDTGVPCTITSSNPAAASALKWETDWDAEGIFIELDVVIPKTVEKATNVSLTIKTVDGSNKSCKVNLKLMPKLEIKHTLPEWLGMHYLAAGYSTPLKAAFGTTAAKVDWTVTTRIEATDPAAKAYAEGFTAQIAKAVTVTSAGKLSVDKSLTDVLKGFEDEHFDKIKVYADVTATTKDGKSYATATYRITAPVEKLYSRSYTDYDSSIYENYTLECNINLGSYVNSMLMITSSHPELFSWDVDKQPEYYLAGGTNCYLCAPLKIRETVAKKTKVTLTIKTIDGTNQSFKFYMTLIP